MVKTKRNHRTTNKQDRLTTILRHRLVTLRDAHKLTNVGWARASKQTTQDVSRFALGKMAFPSLDFIDALCRVFQVTLLQVLANDVPAATTDPADQRVIDELNSMDLEDRHAFERTLFRQRGTKASGR